MQTQDTAATITSLKKLEAEPNGVYKRWEDEITCAEKEMGKFWKAARLTIRRYIDDRDATEVQKRWYNVFSTNVGIMEASLYDQTPEATVSRRFLDMDDDVGRVAGNILERCINQDMDEADCDFDAVMRHAVFDRLVPGLGAAWLRLENEFQEIEGQLDPETQEPLKKIVNQEVAIDWVFYEDFIFSPCRVWEERRWVARKVYMTRDQLVKRWGEEKGKQVPLTTQSSVQQNLPNGNTPSNMVLKRGCVYEIWDRESRKVIWFAKGMDSILEERDDFLKLRNGRFEPCPKPLFANLTTSNCLPKPDFAMLQDQYNELDEVNNRISLLIIACKVVGVYDRSADGIQRMLTEGYDNILIPVDNWAMFAEKNGVKGQVDWLPLDTVVQSLQHLQAHREAIKSQIYELTGINDIVRGNTKASETLGAQEIKAKFASVRIQKLQDEVTRFAEEILQIKAEILCKHFDPMILAEMSNVANMDPNDQQLAVPALELLKGPEDKMEWRVTIQSDAMAIIDYNQQKQERTEFLTAVATFLQSAATVAQNAPELKSLMAELLKFGVAGFRVGKDIEGVFDRSIAEMKQAEEQAAANPQPDPEQQKMEAEMQMKQQEAQLKAQTEQQKLQADMVKQQNEMAMEAQRQAQELEFMR